MATIYSVGHEKKKLLVFMQKLRHGKEPLKVSAGRPSAFETIRRVIQLANCFISCIQIYDMPIMADERLAKKDVLFNWSIQRIPPSITRTP
jgi:hypothetical protein